MFPEYVEDVDWFEKEKIGFCYNMMISEKKVLDEYCERLINVWVHHQGLWVKEVTVYLTDFKFATEVRNKIVNLLKRFIME